MSVFNLGIICGLFIIIMCVRSMTANEPFHANNQFDFTLIGSNGDLAKKYLWQGLFDLFQNLERRGDTSFAFYGSSRKNYAVGSAALKGTLGESIRCPNIDHSCDVAKQSFFDNVTYVQLKHANDYKEHCRKLNDDASFCFDQDTSCVLRRVFYLSVPPSAYEDIVKSIGRHCRSSGDFIIDLKVVLEKPFGHDENSARDLVKKTSQYLLEKELYR